MSSHQDYYKDLKREAFKSDDDFLEERVKRGLAAGYTFQQCFDRWLKDFEQALYDASSSQEPQAKTQKLEKDSGISLEDDVVPPMETTPGEDGAKTEAETAVEEDHIAENKH